MDAIEGNTRRNLSLHNDFWKSFVYTVTYATEDQILMTI
jgi:hypothetical protein